MILIGSRAVADSLSRPCGKDHDFMATPDELEKVEIYHEQNGDTLVYNAQYCRAYKLSGSSEIYEYDFRPTTQTLLDIYKDKKLNSKGYADLVLTLKMSHRYKKNSPHFLKTMRDIKELRQCGANIPVFLTDWFKEREKETYDYKHPSLMQRKSKFFSDDGILYKYDHDSIHKAVAMFDKPMYQYYAMDGHDVFSDKQKFFNLSRIQQIAGVYEESCVLALERSLIPFEFKPDPNWAFAKALEKVCTSITSGWFREFAWENYDFVMDMHRRTPMRYVNKFNEGLKNGTIKEYRA